MHLIFLSNCRKGTTGTKPLRFPASSQQPHEADPAHHCKDSKCTDCSEMGQGHRAGLKAGKKHKDMQGRGQSCCLLQWCWFLTCSWGLLWLQRQRQPHSKRPGTQHMQAEPRPSIEPSQSWFCQSRKEWGPGHCSA